MSDKQPNTWKNAGGKALTQLENIGQHSNALINFAFEDQELSISDSSSSAGERENIQTRSDNDFALRKRLDQSIRFSKKLVRLVDYLDKRLEKDDHILRKLCVSAESIFRPSVSYE